MHFNEDKEGEEMEDAAAGQSSPDLLTNLMVPRPFGFNGKQDSGTSIIFLKQN